MQFQQQLLIIVFVEDSTLVNKNCFLRKGLAIQSTSNVSFEIEANFIKRGSNPVLNWFKTLSANHAV